MTKKERNQIIVTIIVAIIGAVGLIFSGFFNSPSAPVINNTTTVQKKDTTIQPKIVLPIAPKITEQKPPPVTEKKQAPNFITQKNKKGNNEANQNSGNNSGQIGGSNNKQGETNHIVQGDNNGINGDVTVNSQPEATLEDLNYIETACRKRLTDSGSQSKCISILLSQGSNGGKVANQIYTHFISKGLKLPGGIGAAYFKTPLKGVILNYNRDTDCLDLIVGNF